jgi:nucleotide-binding universal stress UspA family protein
MNAYRTVLVGTDGSDSSMRAVERAGEIAADANAKLVVATAYFPHTERPGWGRVGGDHHPEDALKEGGYKVVGNAPIYEILHEARDRAKAAGAREIEQKGIVGAPVDALVKLAKEIQADLLVVGNVGLSSITGRLLGSVPADVARRSKTDVLIVHTMP